MRELEYVTRAVVSLFSDQVEGVILSDTSLLWDKLNYLAVGVAL